MIKILICGDYCPSNRVLDLVESENYIDIFGEVMEHTAKADYSVVNLEAPVVDSNATPIEKYGPNLKCSPKAVKALKYAGFNMATLANNHFYDYGEKGVEDTLKWCKNTGIDTIGGGKNIREASETLYKEINGEIIAFINCCEQEFSIATETKGGSNPINAIKQYYAIKEAKEKANRVIVITHGGHELYNLPNMRMKETFRFFIDLGADAVVNHHQHCYSGYEIYNSKPIFYGIGNFCFDKKEKTNSLWTEGYMVMLNIDYNISFELIPYIQGKDFSGVHIMSQEQNTEFHKNISNLNNIISNDYQLSSKRKEYMLRTMRWYKLALEPYQGRFLSSMYMKQLLPSCISLKKRLQILNFLQCESHLDRLIFAITHKEDK